MLYKLDCGLEGRVLSVEVSSIVEFIRKNRLDEMIKLGVLRKPSSLKYFGFDYSMECLTYYIYDFRVILVFTNTKLISSIIFSSQTIY